MNPNQTTPERSPGPGPRSSAPGGWELEVVKGRECGRRYPINARRIRLGSGVSPPEGLNLGAHEPAGPRRMAERHAELDLSGPSPRLVDLESPGGTFVNRRRVLPGQAVELRSGDLVDLGAVQVRLVAAATADEKRQATRSGPNIGTPATPSKPVAPGPVVAAQFVHRLPDGATVRSWDDFLTVSTQHWGALREELVSGRLGAFLQLIGRHDLLPPSEPGLDADERLDLWLGRLPSIRPSQPELDVHPRVLTLRTVQRGGTVRRSLAISNVGYRLLKVKLRIEPEGIDWIRLPTGYADRPITTLDDIDVPIEIQLPEERGEDRTAEIVVESNGGTARVRVAVDCSDRAVEAQGGSDEKEGVYPWADLFRALRHRFGGIRLAGWVVIGTLLFGGGRLLMGLSSWMLGLGFAGPVTLPGPAMLMSVAGGLAGSFLAIQRRRLRDLPATACCGTLIGACLSALAVAVCQAFEPWLGEAAWTPIAVWAVIGSVVGAWVGRLAGPRSERTP